MPYNNTPIEPTSEITGTVSLPLARVKKIIHVDEDVANCSNNAAFAITVATELFLQYIVEQTHNVVKAERKVRRNIQYKDVANAVARIDNLEFLTDVVPRTTTFKQYKEKKSNGASTSNGYQDAPPAPEVAVNGVKETVYPDIMDVDSTVEAGAAPTPVNGNSVTPVPVPTTRQT